MSAGSESVATPRANKPLLTRKTLAVILVVVIVASALIGIVLWRSGNTSSSPEGNSSSSKPVISSFTVSPSTIPLDSSATFTVTASGGSLSYAYSGLPAGCSSQDSATLACKPTAVGQYTVSVGVFNSRGTASAATNLSVTANVSQPLFTVALLISPTACGPITLNGSTFSNGSQVQLPSGAFSLSIGSCVGYTFNGWATTGGATVASPTSDPTTVTVTQDGTISATFHQVPPLHYSLAIAISPSACGPIDFNGSPVANGATISVLAGSYSVNAPSCPHYHFATWVAAGGASVGSATNPITTATISTNGSLTATYAQDHYQVTVFVNPSGCGPILLNGTNEASGASVSLVNGTYTLQAQSCKDRTFGQWTTTGGSTVGSPTANSTALAVTANGTVTAVYGSPIHYTIDFTVTPTSCGPITFNGTAQSSGSSGTYLPAAYNASAASCPGHPFDKWMVSGGVLALSPTANATGVQLTANGTLAAAYYNNTCQNRLGCVQGALLYQPSGKNYTQSQPAGTGILTALNGATYRVSIGPVLPTSQALALEGSFSLIQNSTNTSLFNIAWLSANSPSSRPSAQTQINATFNSVGVAITNQTLGMYLTFGASTSLTTPLLYLAFGTYPTFFSNVTIQGVALNFSTVTKILNVNFPWLNATLQHLAPNLNFSTTLVVVVNNTIWLPNGSILSGQAQLIITPQQVAQAYSLLQTLNSPGGVTTANPSMVADILTNLSEELVVVATPSWHHIQYSFLLAPLQLTRSLLQGNVTLFVEESYLGVGLQPGTNPNASLAGSMVYPFIGVTWDQTPRHASGYNSSTVPQLWSVPRDEPVTLQVPATGISLANLGYAIAGMGYTNSQLVVDVASIDNPAVYVMEDPGLLTNINQSAPYRSFALAIIPQDLFAQRSVTQYLNLSGVVYNISYYLGGCSLSSRYPSCPVFVADSVGPATAATHLLPYQMVSLTTPTFVNTTGFVMGTTLKNVNQWFGGASELITASPIDVGLYDIGYSNGVDGYNLPAVRFTWGIGPTLKVTNNITEGLYVPASWVLSGNYFTSLLSNYLNISMNISVSSGQLVQSLQSYIGHIRSNYNGGIVNGSLLVPGVLFMMDLWENSSAGAPILSLAGDYTTPSSCPIASISDHCLIGDLSISANSASYIVPADTYDNVSIVGGSINSASYTRNCVSSFFGCTFNSYAGNIDCFSRLAYNLCAFSPYHVFNVTTYHCYSYITGCRLTWGTNRITKGASYAVSYEVDYGGTVFATTPVVNTVFQ